MNYWYAYKLRGLSIGCQPSDFIEFTDDYGELGAVAYARRLSAKEMDMYELRAIGEEIEYEQVGRG